ncbi:MAG TPA: M28 family peptidase [Planctomycetota bacterium]|nr:M28 family peptidase [Planctomycetota bacterium]HRR80335.1 M28 family peptidase [Planctomycetota bacterium]HRT94141.1 M28 family peptidase [Planctomycetota bacterium]
MPSDPIPALLRRVSERRIRRDTFALSKDPLPFRTLSHTRPGQAKTTLDEADDFLQARLESCGYAVERQGCLVQAFRRDRTKNIHHQYSPPHAHDPWRVAWNLSVRKTGSSTPDEAIVLVSHKDSQSWIASPGANDNALGTAANLELARVLARYRSRRSFWFLFCNEEHWPWTSVAAARGARLRGEKIVAVFNIDGPGVRKPEDRAAGRMTCYSVFYAPEAERLADLMVEVNRDYALGLIARRHKVDRPGNDDGSFIKEGYRIAVHNIGSMPYADPNYHLEGDVPECCDYPSAAATARATLAAVVRLDLGWKISP